MLTHIPHLPLLSLSSTLYTRIPLAYTPSTGSAIMELYNTPPSLVVLAMIASGELPVKGVICPCPECLKNSRSGSLRKYCVNLEETVIICSNDKCCYISEKAPDPMDIPVAADNTEQGGDLGDMLEALFTSEEMVPEQYTANSLEHSTLSGGTDVFTTSISSIPDKPVPSISSLPDKPAPSISPVLEQGTPIPKKNHSGAIVTASTTNTNTTTSAVCTTPGISPVTTHCTQDYVMLWSNVDALCWLDVLLCMFCYNHSLRNLSDSLPYPCVLKKLLLAFDESQALIAPLQKGARNILHSVMEFDRKQPSVRRGGGHCVSGTSSNSILASISQCTALTSQDINTAKRKIHLAGIKLECAREEIWQAVEQSLQCERGTDYSPVFAFPVLVQTDDRVSRLFLTDYTWSMDCVVCHHHHTTREKKHLITFPKLTHRFNINSGEMIHEHTCVKCLAPNQWMKLSITRYAPNLVMHFAEGLRLCDVDGLSFSTSCGSRYTVTSVVEYRTSPDHFAVWTRKVKDKQSGTWMCYDDMQSQYAQFSMQKVQLPPENIHIVLWECVSPSQTSAHSTPTGTKATVHLGNVPVTPKQVSLLANKQATSAQYQPISTRSVISTREAVPTLNAPPQLVNHTMTAPPSSTRSPGNDSGSTSSVTVFKKPIALLTPRLSSKTSIPDSLTSKPHLNSQLNQLSRGSYSDIMGALARMEGPPSFTPDVARSSSDPQLTRISTDSQFNKSYLDLVQPLLKKNKEQKGRLLTGYVPKSLRNRNREMSPEKYKRKKVMFTVSSGKEKEKRKITKSHSSIVSTLDVGAGNKQPAATPTPPKSVKRTAKASTLVDAFVPYNPVKERAAQEPTVCQDDMPSLEDMLNDIN